MKPLKLWKVDGGNRSSAAKVILEELVERKVKLENYERARFRWSVFVLCCVGILFLIGYQIATSTHFAFNRTVLTVLTGQPMVLVMMILIAVGFLQTRFFDKKAAKAEKEYDALREEIIERNGEIWGEDPEWKKKEVIFSHMKKEHDINLFHK